MGLSNNENITRFVLSVRYGFLMHIGVYLVGDLRTPNARRLGLPSEILWFAGCACGYTEYEI